MRDACMHTPVQKGYYELEVVYLDIDEHAGPGCSTTTTTAPWLTKQSNEAFLDKLLSDVGQPGVKVSGAGVRRAWACGQRWWHAPAGWAWW